MRIHRKTDSRFDSTPFKTVYASDSCLFSSNISQKPTSQYLHHNINNPQTPDRYIDASPGNLEMKHFLTGTLQRIRLARFKMNRRMKSLRSHVSAETRGHHQHVAGVCIPRLSTGENHCAPLHATFGVHWGYEGLVPGSLLSRWFGISFITFSDALFRPLIGFTV
jgi:hypothetical protein